MAKRTKGCGARNHILAHVHRIPGLREWFYFTEDDVLLVGSFAWDLFLDEGGRLRAYATDHFPALRNRCLDRAVLDQRPDWTRPGGTGLPYVPLSAAPGIRWLSDRAALWKMDVRVGSVAHTCLTQSSTHDRKF